MMVLPGSKTRHAARLRAEFFDRRRADGGDVQAHVLMHVGDLDERPTADLAEFSRAVDHGVGPLDGLDGDDVFVHHGDGLSDVEPADGLADVPSEADVIPLLVGGGARVMTPGVARCSAQ